MTSDPEVRVRRLGSSDAVIAQALAARFHDSELPRSYCTSLLDDAANLLVVAEAGDGLLGFVWAHWLPRLWREGRQLFVYEVEVIEEQRRRGIGTELMRFVLAEAAGAGADAFLLTNRSNPGAMTFYESLGGRAKTGDDLLFAFPAP